MARTHLVPDRHDCIPLGHRRLESGAHRVYETDHFERRPSCREQARLSAAVSVDQLGIGALVRAGAGRHYHFLLTA